MSKKKKTKLKEEMTESLVETTVELKEETPVEIVVEKVVTLQDTINAAYAIRRSMSATPKEQIQKVIAELEFHANNSRMSVRQEVKMLLNSLKKAI